MRTLRKFQSILFNVVYVLSVFHITVVWSIGVNYGTLGDNLPLPTQVAEFLETKTSIDRIKLFDANPDIVRAFANSSIAVTITVPNGEIPGLVQLPKAKQWVAAHVTPFVPQTNIIRVMVGNEIIHWGPQNLIDNLVAAMRTLYRALQQAGHRNIQVSTPHSLGIIGTSEPPSKGQFRSGLDVSILKPMLKFHRETQSPFVVNPYPYYSTGPDNVDFCIFGVNNGRFDNFTKNMYFNMFELQMDGVFSAMKALGYEDVDIVVGETGWPTVAEPSQTWVSRDIAQTFNSRLAKAVSSGNGTPLMPGRKFETYIFSLFTENQKPGSISEKNFGLFRPDFTPVYNVDFLRNEQKPPPYSPSPSPSFQQSHTSSPSPSPGAGRKWCVPIPEARDAQLQANINYVCSQGVDCSPIQAGGTCFDPNNVRFHAAYAMNAYYQTNGRLPSQCDFANTGFLSTLDPSNGKCRFL